MANATEVAHEITVAAPAKAVFDLISDVTNWPQLFPPTVHVTILEQDGASERIQIWATANGEGKTWTSRRTFDHSTMRVDFRQEVSAPPVASMGGAWVVQPISEYQCLVRLLHDYRAVGDDPEKLEWIDKAVDRNSNAELTALKENAELAAGGSERLFSFDDTVTIAGTAENVYDFLNEADKWQQRLPHVAKVDLREPSPGLQVLAMDTRTKDGSTHTTESVRVCLPSSTIVYKQTTLPPLMTLHTGQWSIEPADSGVAVTSRHTVVINPDTIESILGAGADVADARAYVQKALSGNSLATLQLAREHAEAGRR